MNVVIWRKSISNVYVYPHQRVEREVFKNPASSRPTLNLMGRYYRQVKTWHERNDWHFVGLCVVVCGDYFVMVDWWYDTLWAKNGKIVQKNYMCMKWLSTSISKINRFVKVFFFIQRVHSNQHGPQVPFKKFQKPWY